MFSFRITKDHGFIDGPTYQTREEAVVAALPWRGDSFKTLTPNTLWITADGVRVEIVERHVVVVHHGDGEVDSVYGPFNTESDAIAWADDFTKQHRRTYTLVTDLESPQK